MKNNKRILLISIIVMILIGATIAYTLYYKEKQQFVYTGENVIEKSTLTRKQIKERIFVEKVGIVNIYMNDKQIVQYKLQDAENVKYMINNIYSRIYKNKPVKESNVDYDIKIKFNKKKTFYLNTREEKRKAMFDNDGKLYTCVLKEDEYEILDGYLKISHKFRNNFN